MTALPDSDAATSLLLNALFSNKRRMASATPNPSMMAPSTMLSDGTGSLPHATTLNPRPTALSSIALTALEPMSRPTTDLDFPRPNTCFPVRKGWNGASASANLIPTSTDAAPHENWRQLRRVRSPDGVACPGSLHFCHAITKSQDPVT